jgi:NADH-quinone oxidoreductase subunit G
MAEMVKTDTVTVVIDGKPYEFPKGTNLVDAAKTIGNDVPVFCYHPKLDPVGMCRMCLVDIGHEMRDRATGELMLDEETGEPQIRWGRKLETACTQTTSNGMHVKTNTEQVTEARNDVLEFLLTSHPLDCPVCDKGGECPLQNLTMEHGPEASRMYFEDKMHLDKHYPLGDLIYLDRERCIQCARCTRFQEEIAGDDVLAFHERGRRLQIITNSDPGFDSYFSGNTTDICPVGALTTDDFRFGARPWELTNIASISPHDPVGANITLSTRLDRDFGGKAMIKRIMPRQNEQVNEIWIDDKTRFGHHFTRDTETRLLEPMVRDGELGAASWGDALAKAGELLKGANGSVSVLASSYMSNEDLWALRGLVEGVGGERFGAWTTQAGAELVAQVGVGRGTNLSDLGKGDAVLVVATDLEEEAPLYRLRLKQARERGAKVFVANARSTRMDDFVRRSERLRYGAGEAVNFIVTLRDAQPEVAKEMTEAENLIIVAGAEGLSLDGSQALMQAAANFLIETDHVGRPNNGLIGLLPGPNGMGLYYAGYSVEATQNIMNNPPKVLVVAQADLMYDDPAVANWMDKVDTVIQLTLFTDEALPNAQVVLPVQSFAERDGTYTNVERRVQRFYTGQGPLGQALPAWQIASRLHTSLNGGREKLSAAAVMLDITRNVPAMAECRYKNLARTETQYPLIGRDDVYYGGTAYDNNGGLGVQIASVADSGERVSGGAVRLPEVPTAGDGQLVIVPTRELYNQERVFRPSIAAMMAPRTPAPYVEINATDAEAMGIASGDTVTVDFGGGTVEVIAHANGKAPQGVALLPRHLAETATPMTLTVGTVSKK